MTGLELEVVPDKVNLGLKQGLYDTALKSNLFPQQVPVRLQD